MVNLRALSILFWIGLLCMLTWNPATAADGQRDFSVMPRVAMENVPIAGEYWALLIGINQYQHVPPLATAVQDARAVREVLVERYGFAPERIMALLDEQATRAGIEGALYQLGRKAGPDDSVLIYYAGHGQYDDDGRLGWWVPVEANALRPGMFITNASVRS